MPMKSKSRTIINNFSERGGRDAGRHSSSTGRLPTHRAPTHPGEMLLEEFIKPLGITQSELAVRLGISFPRLNEVIRKKRSLTPDTALRLERVLSMPAEFWLGLQLDWDLWHAMRGENAARISKLLPLEKMA
jgi:antitoxin HigA-1